MDGSSQSSDDTGPPAGFGRAKHDDSRLSAASQGALALLLKAGMKPAAAMIPAAFALIFDREGRDAMEKAE
jgi:hypothetical protein